MSRFLFISLPLPGHILPMAAVHTELTGLGHEVAWAGSESTLRPFLGEDAQIFPIPLRAHRGQRERGMAATKSRWEGYIVPHARVTRKGVEAAVESFRPDVLVVDQHAIAGAVIAHKAGLRWASVAPTTMELTRPLAVLPKVEAWIGERMAEIWAEAGMPGAPPHDLRFSPHLLLAFTGRALMGALPVPDNAKLVGPALTQRPQDPDFPWDWFDPQRSQVLVSVGTLSMDIAESFYHRITEALRPLADRLQAIVVAPEGVIADPPEHLLVRTRVPMLELLPRLSAVVCHGGLNTVCEALFHGVPLIVTPIKGDQAINASQVAEAGAGLRMSFDRAGAVQLREALTRVLDDPAFRKSARQVGESFAAAGGATAAALHLEQLSLTVLPVDPAA
jgi:MGT family glycosyltransferase